MAGTLMSKVSLKSCFTNGNLMPQELADIITHPLNPSSEDEDVTVDDEDISDVVSAMTMWLYRGLFVH